MVVISNSPPNFEGLLKYALRTILVIIDFQDRNAIGDGFLKSKEMVVNLGRFMKKLYMVCLELGLRGSGNDPLRLPPSPYHPSPNTL